MTKDFALDQPRACFQRSGVTDAVVNKAKCNGVKRKPAARATPSPVSPHPHSPLLHRPRVGAVRGARTPRGALPPPRWTQPALGDRQLPAVTASGVRGAGAWGPGCLRLETQRPQRERPARVSVLIAFFIFYICAALMSWGFVALGRGGVSLEPTPSPTSLIKLSHRPCPEPLLGQVLDN